MKDLNLKVGQKVWTITEGDCTVESLTNSGSYPIEVSPEHGGQPESYTSDGRRFTKDNYPSLFLSNPLKEGEYPKVMEVRANNSNNWFTRVVFMEKDGKFLAWNGAKTLEESKGVTSATAWSHARDIEHPLSLTLQEVAEKFGVKKVVIVDENVDPTKGIVNQIMSSSRDF